MSIPVHVRSHHISIEYRRSLRNSLTLKTFERQRRLSSRLALHLPTVRQRKAADVAQRSIEILIGRLITDEAFRSAFRTNAIATLTGFVESGYELTALEIAAVRVTPIEVWEQVAGQIDPRLQKVSYTRACLG